MTEKQRLGQPLFPSLKDDARVTEDEPLTLKVGLELLNISKRMDGARSVSVFTHYKFVAALHDLDCQLSQP